MGVNIVDGCQYCHQHLDKEPKRMGVHLRCFYEEFMRFKENVSRCIDRMGAKKVGELEQRVKVLEATVSERLDELYEFESERHKWAREERLARELWIIFSSKYPEEAERMYTGKKFEFVGWTSNQKYLHLAERVKEFLEKQDSEQKREVERRFEDVIETEKKASRKNE